MRTISKPWRDSAVRVEISLPRVKVKGGRVGHVLINGERIAMGLMPGAYPDHGVVACHGADFKRWMEPDYSPADPEDPTCRSCIRAMKFVDVVEVGA